MRRLLRRPKGQVPETAVDRPAQNLKGTPFPIPRSDSVSLLKRIPHPDSAPVPRPAHPDPASTLSCLPCPDFDLTTTLASGQVFRWRPWEEGLPGGGASDGRGRGPGFVGWIGSNLVGVFQRDQRLFFQGAPPEAMENLFSLDVDLKTLARQIDVDPIVHEALKNRWGLRLIRQEPWECLASFILSSFNNIPRLTGMLNRLAARLGRPTITWPRKREIRHAVPYRLPENAEFTQLPEKAVPHRFLGPEALAEFPSPEALAGARERTLRHLGLGFRALLVRAAALSVVQGKADLEGWRTLDDESLRRALRTIPGVGEKVVECVMLFAYQRYSAFPVDVWIGRAMRAWYFRGRKVTDRRIREFALRHFGPFCGWAQQYLYCHVRVDGLKVEPRLTRVGR